MGNAAEPLEPEHSALFLDVDGTLLEIEPHPENVRADDRLRRLLEECLEELGGALALVSGRTIEALDRIFGPATFPVCGAHGAEIRLADGKVRPSTGHELPQEVLDRLSSFEQSHEGILLEQKPGGVSLHYRRAPELELACRKLVQSVFEELASDFRIIDGKMVLELAPVGANKGEAIREVMHQPPYSGRRPVFLGDDVTDEDGFRVVNALGGISVRVGGCGGSEAHYELADVNAVHDWLRLSIG